MTTWDPRMAGKKCDGPGGCGHALSRHNTLGYCRHWSKRDGHCICGDWRAEHMRQFNRDGSIRTPPDGGAV